MGNLNLFFNRNPEYFVCSLIYYLFAVWWFGVHFWAVWVILALLYFVSLSVAFSPLGEELLRFFNHVRKLETSKEKEYLLPIFQEVYEKAKANTAKNLDNSDINIYIIDSMTVNAFAIGQGTIAVTKGAISAFSEDELKSVIAHEIAHISNFDTLAKIYVLIGNGIFSACILVYKIFCFLLKKLIPPTEKTVDFIEMLFDGIVFIFLFLLQITMAISSRKSERRADSYAVGLGYGAEMVSALYFLEKMSLSGESSLVERILASHPRITSRIEALEIQLGIQ
jgi:heat shock protein HtpX